MSYLSQARFNEVMRLYQEVIDKYGWAVIGVFPTEDNPGPQFSYTLGLTAQGWPELVIAGLRPQLAQTLLNDLGRRIFDRAERFSAGQVIDDLIQGDHPVVIVEGRATEDLYPGMAIRKYGEGKVAVQQVVWPDEEGRFPWDEGYSFDDDVQPLLDSLRR